MPFTLENPMPGPGRKPGAKSTSTKLIELLGLGTINNALIEDFRANKGIVRQFVYDHIYGKAINKSENINQNSNFDRIEITLIKSSDTPKQLPVESQNKIEIQPKPPGLRINEVRAILDDDNG
jgi:hypothetical protein